MQKKANYKTKQWSQIWAYIDTLGLSHFTAAQLLAGLKTKGCTIGAATVYRFLEKECKENSLSKFATEAGASAYYQNNRAKQCCNDTYHFKCETCGALLHLHCSMIENLQSHFENQHNMKINAVKTTFYGVCDGCLASH